MRGAVCGAACGVVRLSIDRSIDCSSVGPSDVQFSAVRCVVLCGVCCDNYSGGGQLYSSGGSWSRQRRRRRPLDAAAAAGKRWRQSGSAVRLVIQQPVRPSSKHAIAVCDLGPPTCLGWSCCFAPPTSTQSQGPRALNRPACGLPRPQRPQRLVFFLLPAAPPAIPMGRWTPSLEEYPPLGTRACPRPHRPCCKRCRRPWASARECTLQCSWYTLVASAA